MGRKRRIPERAQFSWIRSEIPQRLIRRRFSPLSMVDHGPRQEIQLAKFHFFIHRAAVFLSSAQKFVWKFHNTWFQLGLDTLSLALDAVKTGVNSPPKRNQPADQPGGSLYYTYHRIFARLLGIQYDKIAPATEVKLTLSSDLQYTHFTNDGFVVIANSSIGINDGLTHHVALNLQPTGVQIVEDNAVRGFWLTNTTGPFQVEMDWQILTDVGKNPNQLEWIGSACQLGWDCNWSKPLAG
ncbi:hypothetical protein B0H13DRAFT_1919648 [Mycena leptocephala]|nr:hypothetical protein B0H13DRAFT_1919648 [Mycena leptocephala]